MSLYDNLPPTPEQLATNPLTSNPSNINKNNNPINNFKPSLSARLALIPTALRRTNQATVLANAGLPKSVKILQSQTLNNKFNQSETIVPIQPPPIINTIITHNNNNNTIDDIVEDNEFLNAFNHPNRYNPVYPNNYQQIISNKSSQSLDILQSANKPQNSNRKRSPSPNNESNIQYKNISSVISEPQSQQQKGSHLSISSGEEAFLRRQQLTQSLQQNSLYNNKSNVVVNESPVILLTNMVGSGEVDDELRIETASECSKYGKVLDCVVIDLSTTNKFIDATQAVRIFVHFDSNSSAAKALADLNGRYFAGRKVQATYFPLIKFQRLQLTE